MRNILVSRFANSRVGSGTQNLEGTIRARLHCLLRVQTRCAISPRRKTRAPPPPSRTGCKYVRVQWPWNVIRSRAMTGGRVSPRVSGPSWLPVGGGVGAHVVRIILLIGVVNSHPCVDRSIIAADVEERHVGKGKRHARPCAGVLGHDAE